MINAGKSALNEDQACCEVVVARRRPMSYCPPSTPTKTPTAKRRNSLPNGEGLGLRIEHSKLGEVRKHTPVSVLDYAQRVYSVHAWCIFIQFCSYAYTESTDWVAVVNSWSAPLILKTKMGETMAATDDYFNHLLNDLLVIFSMKWFCLFQSLINLSIKYQKIVENVHHRWRLRNFLLCPTNSPKLWYSISKHN